MRFWQREARIFGSVLVGMLLLVAVGMSAASEDADAKAFAEWSALARSRNLSPVIAGSGDLSYSWVGPDGQPISVVVRSPHSMARDVTVAVRRAEAGEDATPLVKRAIQEAVASRATQIVFSPGEYHFLTSDPEAHMVLRGLSNVTIEGSGASLIFHNNKAGVLIQSCSQVRVRDLTLRSALKNATVMRAVDDQNARALAPIEGAGEGIPPTVTNVAAYDAVAHNWIKDGLRIIFPPATNPAITQGPGGTFHSRQFGSLKIGATYIVYHYYYAAPIVMVDDNKLSDTNDLIFDKIAITSGAGMGLVVYKMGRGVAIVNSRIQASDGPMSTLFDALSFFFTKGDIVVSNNLIANQGDDALNLVSPIHEIASVGASDSTHYWLDTTNHSQTLASGNKVAVFDHEDGKFLGVGTVTEARPMPGPGRNRVNVEISGVSITTGMFLRNLNFGQGRFVLENNRIEKCNCHAFLIQVPNGLVSNNVVDDIKANAVKLITNVGQWKEGTGAFNIILRGNTTNKTGPDKNLNFPFGVVSAYGVMRKNSISAPVNDYLLIEDNVFSSYTGKCISIEASQHVTIRNNVCKNGVADDDFLLVQGKHESNVTIGNRFELVKN